MTLIIYVNWHIRKNYLLNRKRHRRHLEKWTVTSWHLHYGDGNRTVLSPRRQGTSGISRGNVECDTSVALTLTWNVRVVVATFSRFALENDTTIPYLHYIMVVTPRLLEHRLAKTTQKRLLSTYPTWHSYITFWKKSTFGIIESTIVHNNLDSCSWLTTLLSKNKNYWY